VAEAQLRRRLGPGLLTAYGVGVMVGAGIYVLVGAMAAAAGVLAPLAFLCAAVIVAPTAMSYAELAARLPEAGGEVAYLREAFGVPALTVAVGLAICAAGTISAAAVLRGGVGYLADLWDAPRLVLLVGLGGALTVAAVIGVLESLAIAALFTMVEVAGLMIVAAVGLTGPVSPDWTAGAVGAGPAGVGIAAILAFFAFIGFEDMVNMAEETREPERTLPRAILLALALVAALYALVSVAAVRTAPIAALAASERPLTLVFETATGADGRFLSVIAVVAALNGVLAQIVMAARVLFGLGRRGGAFAPLGAVNARFGTPARATVLVGALVLVSAAALPVGLLAQTTSAILLCVFCVVNAALIRLHWRAPRAEGWRAPRWAPWLGMSGALTALALGLSA
jgi:amino acid transporter